MQGPCREAAYTRTRLRHDSGTTQPSAHLDNLQVLLSDGVEIEALDAGGAGEHVRRLDRRLQRAPRERLARHLPHRRHVHPVLILHRVPELQPASGPTSDVIPQLMEQ